MKKISLIIAFAACSLLANASDTLQVAGLASPASLSYTSAALQLDMEGMEPLALPIISADGKENISPTDRQKLQDALGLDASGLAKTLGAVDTNQLGTLLVSSAKQNGNLVFANTEQPNAAEPGGTPVSVDESKDGWGWKLWALLGALALLVVVGIGYFMKKNKEVVMKENNSDNNLSVNDKAMAKANTQTKSEKIGPLKQTISNLNGTIKELEKKVKVQSVAMAELQEQLKVSKTQSQDLNTNLQSWAQQLKAALTKYVNPMHAALESGDKGAAIGNALQAAVQLGSMAKIATKTSEGYDGANAQYLLSGTAPAGNYPTIDGATPQDKVPRNVKTLVEILKANGAQWDDTIVKDYKIGKLQ